MANPHDPHHEPRAFGCASDATAAPGMVDVAFCTDSNYVDHMLAAIASVAYNASKLDALRIWVVGFELTAQDKARIDACADRLEIRLTHVCADSVKTQGFHLSGHLTASSYIRLQLPDLLDDVNHLIYLDCDLVVEDDIALLSAWYSAPTTLSAVRDPGFDRWSDLQIPTSNGYFNAGVLILHLEPMRQNRFFARAVECAASLGDRAKAHDQDVLNKVMDGQWTPVPDRWNLQHTFFSLDSPTLGIDSSQRDLLCNEPSIIHYTGSVKPWTYHCTHPLRDRYFFYRAQAGLPDLKIEPAGPSEICKRILKRMLRRP